MRNYEFAIITIVLYHIITEESYLIVLAKAFLDHDDDDNGSLQYRGINISIQTSILCSSFYTTTTNKRGGEHNNPIIISI